jgi:hypothetical protein
MFSEIFFSSIKTKQNKLFFSIFQIKVIPLHSAQPPIQDHRNLPGSGQLPARLDFNRAETSGPNQQMDLT